MKVYVECAPDAIELFQAHGPFPTATATGCLEVERYGDYGSITDADRGSERLTGGADGTPKFALAYADIFFSKIRHMVPKRPMMLRNVMGANEFAEQIGVINRDMDRLSKPWKISYTLFVLSAVAILPSAYVAMVPPIVWAVFGWENLLWIPLMIFILFAPFIGFIGSLFATVKTKKSSEKKLAAILENQAARWESRGIEWFLSEEEYHLTVGFRNTRHTERRVSSHSTSLSLSLSHTHTLSLSCSVQTQPTSRYQPIANHANPAKVTVRVLPEAADKFKTMGPFTPGEIDGDACVTYDLTSF